MTPNWYAIRNVQTETAEVSIYDEIGLFGIKAREFSNSLKSLGERRITLRIHSPGGEIFEGSAIYNALRRHKGGVDVAIDGLAASMASVIAMAGEKRSMAANAMLMIHNPFTVTFGESKDLRRDADLMDDLKEGIISAYAGRTGIKREKLAKMMDEETWMNAEEAQEMGFVTEITERFDMRNSFERFDINKFSNRPNDFMAKKPESKQEVSDVLPEAIETPVTTEASVVDRIEAGIQAERAEHAQIVADLKAAHQVELSTIEASYRETIAAKDAIIDKKDQEFARLEVAMQVAPAKEVVIVPAQDPKSNLEIYNEMSDGPDRTAFYKAHRDELVMKVNQKA